MEKQKLAEKDRIDIHKNACLTLRGRGILILRLERGEHAIDIATAMGVSARTVYKWQRRYRNEGPAGLRDRSSRPNASPNKTPVDIEAKVIALRMERRIYHRIAAEAGVSKAAIAWYASLGITVESALFWQYCQVRSVGLLQADSALRYRLP